MYYADLSTLRHIKSILFLYNITLNFVLTIVLILTIYNYLGTLKIQTVHIQNKYNTW